MISIADFSSKLNLELLSVTTRTEMDINVTDINRPGMQFCGFYEYFAHELPHPLHRRLLGHDASARSVGNCPRA